MLDLNDVLKEGDFVDSFGNQPPFTNWRQGEPSNDDLGEDYVTFYLSDGTWNDVGKIYSWMNVYRLPTICQLVC